MKKIILTLLISLIFSVTFAQTARPVFHHTPPQNWVNDPNGLVYLDGEYHLFYQYNPFGDKWGHMSWAHAVSKNLQNWKSLPLALPEIPNADGSTTMIFSGCAVVDSLNTSGLFAEGFKKGMVAIFTSHVSKPGKDIGQHQSLAYSSDKGRTWKYFDKNPVLDIGLTNFRDPNVIWWPSEKKWIMTVVKPLDYIAQFYESKDLKSWKLMSEFGKKGDMTKIWECPSLVKIPVENSKESKWVLMISSGHRQAGYLAMQYFVGDFDGKIFVAQKQDEVLYIDEGKDFYAAIPYFNLPKTQKNPIIIGWTNDWEYANEIPAKSYRGGFSIARKLSLYKDGDTFILKQSPIVDQTIDTEVITIKVGQKYVSNIGVKSKNVYRLKLDIEIGNGFDLNLLQSENAACKLSFDPKSNLLSFDRTKSGQVDFHKRFPSVESVVVKPEKGRIKLEILVDKNIVEIFAQDGKVVITDLVFPLDSQMGIKLDWN
jgi:fructan beta-fructosidase